MIMQLVIVKFVVYIILGIICVFLFNELFKCVYNLIYYYKHKNDPNAPRTHSMVYNKKTGKLEDDCDLILPF